MFSKKATKMDEIFTIDLVHYVVSVKSVVKISSIFAAFLENMNFKRKGTLTKFFYLNSHHGSTLLVFQNAFRYYIWVYRSLWQNQGNNINYRLMGLPAAVRSLKINKGQNLHSPCTQAKQTWQFKILGTMQNL